MRLIYHNRFLPRLLSDLVSISLNEEQPNLWRDTMSYYTWSASKGTLFEPATAFRWVHTYEGRVGYTLTSAQNTSTLASELQTSGV